MSVWACSSAGQLFFFPSVQLSLSLFSPFTRIQCHMPAHMLARAGMRACIHTNSHTHTHTRTCAWTECLTALWPASQRTIIIFLRGSHWTDCQLSTFQRLKSSSQRKCEWSFYFIFLPYFTVNTTLLILFRSGSSTFRVQREIKVSLSHSLFL